MKAVVGVSGSDRGNQAVRFMNSLLSPDRDELLLFSSVPKFQFPSKPPLSKGILDSASKTQRNSVLDAATYCLSPEVRAITSTHSSNELPCEGLIELTDEEDVDLVVLGSKEAARASAFRLGRTAWTVIHHVSNPVLVVRGDLKRPNGTFKVVIACDEDRWCENKDVLREFSWPRNTESTLFHVMETRNETLADSEITCGATRDPQSDQHMADYRTRLKSLQQTGPKIIQNAKVEVTHGDVVDEIVDKVKRDPADLLVISSRDLRNCDRMLGSITESLLSRCPCSILIARVQETVANAQRHQQPQLG